jgi:putative ABC transport system permease protein
MLRLVLRTLRARMGGFVAAFISLFFAAALMAGCGILMETGIRGETPTERYEASPVVVAAERQPSPGSERVRIDAGLAARIQAVPGVRTVVPDLSFPAVLIKDGNPVADEGQPRSVGHSWSSAVLTPFQLREGRAPGVPGEIVLDSALASLSGVRTGDEIPVQGNDSVKSYRVVGVAAAARELRAESSVFFAPAEAERLAGHPGKVDAFGVLPESTVDMAGLAARIDAAVPGVIAVTGDARGLVEFGNVGGENEMLISMSGVFGSAAALVAIFVVAGTFTLSTQQRRREIALLRAIGSTPGQVRTMIAGEAFVVALLASVPGCLLGTWIARIMFDQFLKFEVVPRAVALHVDVVPLGIAIGAGVLTAILATLGAANRAARTRPTEALIEARIEFEPMSRRRRKVATFCLIGSATVIVFPLTLRGDAAIGAANATVMLAVTAAALFGPAIVRFAALVLGGPIRRLSRVSGFLAVANSRVNTRRVASATAPLILAIGFSATMIFLQTTNLAAGARSVDEAVAADHVVISSAGGLPPTAAEDLRKVAGVHEATGVKRTSVVTTSGDEDASQSITALALTPGDLAGTVTVPVVSGEMNGVRGDGVALSADRAEMLGAKLGDRIRLLLADGAETGVRVAAIFDSGALSEILVPTGLVAGHTSSELLDAVMVRRVAGADAGAVVAGLSELAGRWPGLTVTDKAGMQARLVEEREVQAWISFLIVGAIVAYTGLAVVNTLVMSTISRAREFALLRLTGATRSQVMRMMRWESLLVVTMAIVVGAAVAAETLIPFSVMLSGSAVPVVPPLIAIGIVGGVTLLALLATEVPTRLVLRQRPVDAIGIRE